MKRKAVRSAGRTLPVFVDLLCLICSTKSRFLFLPGDWEVRAVGLALQSMRHLSVCHQVHIALPLPVFLDSLVVNTVVHRVGIGPCPFCSIVTIRHAVGLILGSIIVS
jgi:hypothetical protein